MPLPYTKHYEGLGTGLYKAFKNQKLGLNVAYVNGSVNRLEGLQRNRYDFIIVSALTADYLAEHHDVDVVGIMPEGSYVSQHVIVYKGIRISKCAMACVSGLIRIHSIIS